ncbi:vitamin B12 transporter [Paenochrobactrum gallinarii]|uniref:Heme transporter BhuA n=2 Tax=Paenochrobactrum gallinarii TaxID=643673 RepID=A0A841M6W6_9HYPH|nr:TonB-dependent receptor [Paenochrobactrum gallinarii]MBB6262001.1 vitamin B12 transporter [Paenochrobactrum gallinarii]
MSYGVPHTVSGNEMLRKTVLLSGIAVGVAAGWAVAVQAQPALNENGEIVLKTITVTTPLRRASALERSTSSVTVIGEKDIDQSAAPDLQSLLKIYTGVTMTANGGQGATSGVSLRGFSSSQTLVLVNGVRMGSATSGTPNLSSIPLASVERIEIAKGGHSAQYGADAMGGIINIITKQGGACENGKSYCGSWTTGVTHPWGGFASGNISGTAENGIEYGLGANVLGTQGFDFTTGLKENDRDGFLQGSVNLSLAKDVEWGRVYIDGLYTRGRNHYDGYNTTVPDSADTHNFSGRFGARIDHSDDWFSTIELTSSLDKAKQFRASKKGDTYKTERYGVFVSTQKAFNTDKIDHIVVAGGEFYHEKVAGAAYATPQRDISALFAQYSIDYASLLIDAGVRYDHNQQFGDKTTYNIGASYEIEPELILRTSYATGFRAPTFNDLYFPGSGNPDLKTETSKSFEIGLNWHISQQTSFDIVVYQNNAKNQIIWQQITADENSSWAPYNVTSRTRGIEASLSHRLDEAWAVKASIDLRKPINKERFDPNSPNGDDYNGKYMPNADRFKASGELSYRPDENLDLIARVLYGSSRYSNAANTKKLSDYITADFVATYAFDQQSKIKLSVENVFDKQYQTKDGYRMPGRTMSLGFTRSF